MHAMQMVESRPLDMRRFDSRTGYAFASRRVGTFDSPRRNAIYQNYVDHVETESRGDYPGLMATCSKKRQSYASYFSPAGPTTGQPQSYAELEKFYWNLIASNTYLLHREVDKLIVGDDELLVDGVIHQLYPGSLLASRGMPLDPKRVYQLTARVAVVFFFDEDGLGAGEHAYSPPIDASYYTPVEPELVPEVFWNNPLTGRVVL